MRRTLGKGTQFELRAPGELRRGKAAALDIGGREHAAARDIADRQHQPDQDQQIGFVETLKPAFRVFVVDVAGGGESQPYVDIRENQ